MFHLGFIAAIMIESWHVTFQATVDVDTLSLEHPYKQIYDALRDKKIETVRIVSADPICTHKEDDD